MRVYLCQHGKATSKKENPERPLTDEGRQEVTRVGRRLSAAEIRPGAIWHSGKLRAEETARVLARQVAPEIEIREHEGLSPTDDPQRTREALENEGEGDVLLVGHLPHLSRLCSLLIAGDAELEPVAFRNGGVMCLESEGGAWQLRWYLVPELARS